jgi:hypothetical protein
VATTANAQGYKGHALRVLKKISTPILFKKEGSIFSKNLDSLIHATKTYGFLFLLFLKN